MIRADPEEGGREGLMTPKERADLLVAWALEAGFDRAGSATLESLEHGDALTAWLARGDHATMGWMERTAELRREPSRLFPGARSVLCVALQYHPRPSRLESGGGDGAGGAGAGGDLWPRVARYARGRDYHNVMGKRLKKLARRVREAFPGSETRTAVDAGPVLERELAARAGLGAVGKNTLLLSPEGGSWFLLGELFTSLSLAPAPPVADLCGRCTACLEACPTGALPEPYRLDARRCISYWTIEHRGAFPAEVRPLLGGWVFGCDLCQEACPANTDPAPATDPAFDLPPERAELDLEALLGLSAEQYRERFQASPMQRAKREGLRRNAAVAMGHSRDRRYLPALVRALGDPDRDLRREAAWALSRIGGPTAVEELRTALAFEGDPAEREQIRHALETLGG